MDHGAGHPSTVPALQCLLDALMDQAKYRDAEPLAQRILAIREKQDPRGRDVAVALNRLAVVLKLQHKYDAADSLYARCCALLEHHVGAASPAYAAALANRASILRAKRDFDRAEPLYAEALATFERSLGPDHPNVVVIKRHIADNATSKSGLTPRPPDRGLVPPSPRARKSPRGVTALRHQLFISPRSPPRQRPPS